MIFKSSRLLSMVPALGLALACSGEPQEEQRIRPGGVGAGLTVTENRSLAVTEVDVLGQFSFGCRHQAPARHPR